MTEFRMLGPIEGSVDDVPVELPAGKPRDLLARLLLDANRIVPVDALVESIWGDPAPASSRKVLQVYVSQLRKVLGAAAIETRSPGYALRAAREDVDLGRFEALTERARGAGDPARSAELLGQALALWRGPGLVEFRQEPFALPAARRLAGLRLAALEQRIDAELELGRDERLVGELETLVEQEPLREQLRRQLMLALYRSGRQADALERYREGRRLLVEELGIEPSPRLQELEQAILRQDPAVDSPGTQRARGCVICVGVHLHKLLAALARELLLVELAEDPTELAARSQALEQARDELLEAGIAARIACFTSTEPADDLARLAAEQSAELLVLDDPSLVHESDCDVAV